MAFWYSLLVRRREGFDVIQLCNPPDALFVIGLFHKWFGGKRLIFDHHDLSPELFSVKFHPRHKCLTYRLLLWLERLSMRSADVVISVNESLKQIAIERGRSSPDKVFVVRNGPNTAKFTPKEPRPELKCGRKLHGLLRGIDGVSRRLRLPA